MQNEPPRSGPVLTTLKVVSVLGVIVFAVLLVLAAIGLWAGPSQTPTPERIQAECAARFAERDEVDFCVRNLIERAADHERQRLLDDAYRASKR